MPQARRQGKAKKRSKRTAGAGGSWAMLLVGLVSGAILAALFMGVRSGHYGQLGSGLKSLLQNASTPSPTPVTRGSKQPDSGTPGGRKPTLDFYTVLPEIERVMPESDFVADTDKQPARVSSVYMLQAASYRNHADADKLRARLALANFEAQIQKVTVQGKGVFYRVRLGPFADMRKLKTARQGLSQLGIDALPLSLSAE